MAYTDVEMPIHVKFVVVKSLHVYRARFMRVFESELDYSGFVTDLSSPLAHFQVIRDGVRNETGWGGEVSSTWTV
jgi:hypothetical protein